MCKSPPINSQRRHSCDGTNVGRPYGRSGYWNTPVSRQARYHRGMVARDCEVGTRVAPRRLGPSEAVLARRAGYPSTHCQIGASASPGSCGPGNGPLLRRRTERLNVATSCVVQLKSPKTDYAKVLFPDEAEALKKSHWPRCDQLANALAERGPSAIDAILFASKSRVHQVRSACLRALFAVAPPQGENLARQFLADKAYEVRETAAKILGVPIP